jgi:hypothetical protein
VPGLGEILVEVLIRPRREGLIPKRYGECYRGGKLIALSKEPKPGSQPIAIGDAFRRIADKALQIFSRKDLSCMFENTYANVKQFASGSSDGAEKFIITALLALLEDPAPTEAPQVLVCERKANCRECDETSPILCSAHSVNSGAL